MMVERMMSKEVKRKLVWLSDHLVYRRSVSLKRIEPDAVMQVKEQRR